MDLDPEPASTPGGVEVPEGFVLVPLGHGGAPKGGPGDTSALNYRGRLNTFHQKYGYRAPNPPGFETGPTSGHNVQTYVFSTVCTFTVDGKTLKVTGTAKKKKMAARDSARLMVAEVEKMGYKEPPEGWKANKKAAKEARQTGKRKLDISPTGQNAIQILNQFSQRNKKKSPDGPTFTDTFVGAPQDRTYTVTCTIRVNGVCTVAKATGKKKKEAKREAALGVVRKLGPQAMEAEEKPEGEKKQWNNNDDNPRPKKRWKGGGGGGWKGPKRNTNWF